MDRKGRVLALAAVAAAFWMPAKELAWAQAPPPSSTAPAGGSRQSGTVKAVTPTDLVLTTVAGQDIPVNLSAATKVLLVDPATRDVKNARTGSLSDIAAGDKAVISGTTGDTGPALTAVRVLLLKSGAIAALHAEQQAAWARSVGGIVKATDVGTGTITVVNGAHTYTVHTTPSTAVRRYANGSVRFEDAVTSTVAAIQPGDQLQARGDRNADGTTIEAQEIVTGSFSNFSGVLTAVDVSANTVTLKDLATKRTVTVAVTSQSNLRKLPAGFGAGTSARAGTGQGSGQSSEGNGKAGAAGGQGASRTPGTAAATGARRMDLARIVSRLPTESLSELRPGEAVMIVASNSDSGAPTAITMLSGVEQILASSPAGTTTLSPWSLGSGGAEGEAGGEGSGGGGR